MAAIQYRSADVDGFKIFYREAGPADAPKLLLLHGFPSASHMFRDLIPLLADRFHIIAPDLPGFGKSDMPPRGYTFDRIAEKIDRFTDVVGFDRYAVYVFDPRMHGNYRRVSRSPGGPWTNFMKKTNESSGMPRTATSASTSGRPPVTSWSTRGNRMVAGTTRPLVLYESGFAPRWYVARADIDESALTAVDQQTFCPYKGLCSYYDIGDARQAAWSYRQASAEVSRISDFVSFEPDIVSVQIDGRQIHLEPGQTVIPHGPDRDLTVAEALPSKLP
jgi:uncharacterized protein (DUF427 family)